MLAILALASSFASLFFGLNSSPSAFHLLPSSLFLCSPPISKSWISCSGWSTMFPVHILYPLLMPSFPTILPSTHPSLHFPLTFTESLISTTLPSPSLVISGLATCCSLSSSALKYSFNHRLHNWSLHRVMNFNHLVTSACSSTDYSLPSTYFFHL